jgi:hypothetical protein
MHIIGGPAVAIIARTFSKKGRRSNPHIIFKIKPFNTAHTYMYQQRTRLSKNKFSRLFSPELWGIIW